MKDIVVSAEEAERRLIRQEDQIACKLAFIDCKTPGSDKKENYSLIGPGVTTSADQVVNLREPHGFNIGAAAMPRGITNNLHIHFTAEVFLVFGGEYLFRWGIKGADGEIAAGDGAILSLPTWIFRGFTNIGPDDGRAYTVLGGDDTGGIIWDPDIIRDAARYGLYLTRSGRLVDVEAGEPRPAEGDLVRPIQDVEMRALRRWSVEEMRRRVVLAEDRAWSREALLDGCLEGHRAALAPVIGWGLSQDRDGIPPITNPHGFTIEWLRIEPGQQVGPFRVPEKMVLMAKAGATRVELNRVEPVSVELASRDVFSIPGSAWRTFHNPGDVAAELVVVTSGDERKRPEWAPEIIAAVKEAGRGLDHGGYIAPLALLPESSPLLSA